MTGPLTMLRAGDWVARRSKPRSRYYLDRKEDDYIIAINAANPKMIAHIHEKDFTCGAWKLLTPTIGMATILGAFNQPEGK